MPIKSRPKLELPSRVRRATPPDADPAVPPPDAAPASPPPAEAAPAPSPASDAGPTPGPTPDVAPDTGNISDDDLSAALAVIIERGARKTALQEDLKVTKERAEALLSEMEKKGIVGPVPPGRRKRQILMDSWPPAAPFSEMAEALEEHHAADTARLEELENQTEEPSTAEPEPAPAEPAPGETPPETPPAAPETPPAAPERSKWDSIKATFMGAFERFASKFRGEVQPSDEKEYRASWGDVAKNAATGFLSVAASYTGVKILADLPQWLYQKYWTNPAERERLKAAFASKDTETGVEHGTAVDQRKARLEQAINESKFLSKEKRAELLAKLQTSVEGYKTAEETAREKRNEDIAKLLDEAIETRVKNTQVLKEALNSALMVTGLSAMRGVAYGAVAVAERYKEVTATPEGRMHWFRRTVVDGFTETAHNLIGGKADTWTGKGMNFVKGATNVLRAAGFADLAIAEWTTEGRSFSSVIETSLKAWEDKTVAEGVAVGWENIKAPWERLGHLGEYAKSAVTGSEPAPGASPETPGGAAGAGAPGSSEAAAAAGAAGAAGIAAAESAPHVEIPEAQIEAGLVKKGDGIIRILERQGVEGRSALEAAREAGIVRAAGDTRLTTEAIGRLSVFAEAKPEGGIEIKFFDSETDKMLTLAQAREAGFTYESGTVPGELATEADVAKHVPETAEVFTDSLEVPNDLLVGTFHLYTDTEGNFTGLDPGEGDTLFRMNEALQELAQQGHGESPEAKFIFKQYEQLLLNVYEQLLLTAEDTPIADDVPPVEAAEEATKVVVAERAAAPEVPDDDEPLRRFKGEAGKVKFVYDRDTGAVKDAFLPAYRLDYEEISASLKEWGLTPEQVKEKFTENRGSWSGDSHPGRYPSGERPGASIQSASNDYRQFTREVTKLSRQESLLEQMDVEGYRGTPEYAHLKMETELLEATLSGQMDRQFHIKERPI